MSLNRVILAGNLTRDPEIKYLPNGTALCNCCVALNHKWKDEQGQDHEEVTFVDFTAWQKRAETIGQYFKKGNGIILEGRLKMEEWTDKQSGQKRSRLKVEVQNFSFPPSSGNRDGAGAGAPAAPRTQSAPAQNGGPGYAPPDEADDVPF